MSGFLFGCLEPWFQSLLGAIFSTTQKALLGLQSGKQEGSPTPTPASGTGTDKDDYGISSGADPPAAD